MYFLSIYNEGYKIPKLRDGSVPASILSRIEKSYERLASLTPEKSRELVFWRNPEMRELLDNSWDTYADHVKEILSIQWWRELLESGNKSLLTSKVPTHTDAQIIMNAFSSVMAEGYRERFKDVSEEIGAVFDACSKAYIGLHWMRDYSKEELLVIWPAIVKNFGEKQHLDLFETSLSRGLPLDDSIRNKLTDEDLRRMLDERGLNGSLYIPKEMKLHDPLCIRMLNVWGHELEERELHRSNNNLRAIYALYQLVRPDPQPGFQLDSFFMNQWPDSIHRNAWHFYQKGHVSFEKLCTRILMSSNEEPVRDLLDHLSDLSGGEQDYFFERLCTLRQKHLSEVLYSHPQIAGVLKNYLLKTIKTMDADNATYKNHLDTYFKALELSGETLTREDKFLLLHHWFLEREVNYSLDVPITQQVFDKISGLREEFEDCMNEYAEDDFKKLMFRALGDRHAGVWALLESTMDKSSQTPSFYNDPLFKSALLSSPMVSPALENSVLYEHNDINGVFDV